MSGELLLEKSYEILVSLRVSYHDEYLLVFCSFIRVIFFSACHSVVAPMRIPY